MMKQLLGVPGNSLPGTMVKPNMLEYSLSTTLVIETCPPFPHECPPIWAPFECRTFHQGLLLGTCKKTQKNLSFSVSPRCTSIILK